MAADDVQRVLERLVGDAEFRKYIQQEPGQLTVGYNLTPGEAGLLTATTEAAYGLERELVDFQHRMCAVSSD
jgi:hypothetical protein